MDHETAIRDKLAARYLLGELSTEQRDQFEEHFFLCYACANDVRDGASLVANARAVFREGGLRSPAAARTRGGLWAWLRMPMLVPSAIAAVLAAVVAYQSLVLIPRLNTATEPQLVASAALHPTARGDEQAIHVPARSKVFQVTVDVNSSQPYSTFDCEFVDGAGKQVLETTIAPGQVSSFSLLLPSQPFPDGSYTLILRGIADGQRKEIDRFPFLIHRS